MSKNIIILTILAMLVSYTSPLLAQTYMSNIELYDMQNGQAKLRWDTTEATQAMVYWGEIENSLDRFHYYTEFDSQHLITIYGLQKDVTYYFKIIAINRGGARTESFVQTFSTKDMVDTVQPEFREREIIQTTRDAAVISWTTNEETKADVYYGTLLYDLNKKAGHGFAKYHELIVEKLDYGYTYYVKIIAEDRAGNKNILFMDFKAAGPFAMGKEAELKIYNIEPQSFDAELIDSNAATIMWRTNLAAKAKIHYGTESGKYNKHLELNDNKRGLEHEIVLADLEPNTTYYYKVEAHDSLYRKREESREMSLRTSVFSNPTPQVLGTQTASEYIDSDADSLSDGYEYSIGTDPFNADSDGDGYNDGSEMKHGWDPNVAGSTLGTRLQASNYFKPKRDYAYRVEKDRELGLYVRGRLGQVSVSPTNWRILSDAYIYGGYPAEAIVQAIRFGGKTVHPSIEWSAWQGSSQYVEYINK